MRIAISSNGENIESLIDQRFGRCKYFIILDTENKNIIKTDAVINKGAEQGHGAGIKAAEQLGELGVNIVLTGDLGPNATAVLEKLKIKAYRASGKAEDALSNFFDNKLDPILEIGEPHKENKEVSDIIEKKEEKIFFPLMDNKGLDSEISEHFGHAPFFGLYDVEKKELKIVENDLDHADPTKSPIDQIIEAVNPTTIFAKSIGGRAVGIIAHKGLALKTGDYNIVREAIDKLDKLEDLTQDCGHKH